MENTFDLEKYLAEGVENIVTGIMKNVLNNPKESRFIAQYAAQSRRATKLRDSAMKKGQHIPPFLIASITTQCNLHCSGCYARANHSCFDNKCEDSPSLLSTEEWNSIFSQAGDLGVSFILLAGGEPFVRRDVISVAGEHKNILFPIFTNGTMIDSRYIYLLDEKRNLVPIISIEGKQETTDARRGSGIYNIIQGSMHELSKRKLLFGASVTVSKENMDEVLSDSFLNELGSNGCKAIIYVEYVPIDGATFDVALDDESRSRMMLMLDNARARHPEILMVAFPGDEKSSGGCLAAGRGFFHINAYGGAEPCPFSPYSDISVSKTSLLEALQSPLFTKLRSGSLMAEHTGGCVLFAQEENVKRLLEEKG